VVFPLVNTFAPCTLPNTVNSDGRDACKPPTPAHACALSETGRGKVTIAAAKQDLMVAASAKGLTAACDGLQLCVTMSFHATGNDCAGESCTAVELGGTGPACCVVSNGTCEIKSTSMFDGTLIPANNTGLEVTSCGLAYASPYYGTVMSCGILFR